MRCLRNAKENLLILFGFFYVCYIVGLVLFMNGIISSSTFKLQPTPPDTLLEQCHDDINEEICSFQKRLFKKYYSSHSQNIVIIVIDALRVDFIPSIKHNPKFNLSMPFTEALLKNGSAISVITQGFAPTVTLPRIKSLVTGTVSNFIDILFNFNAAKIQEDSILAQASLHGLKSVFYGDNTWLKLFPELFTRSEGTHSFFVSDFKEVDLNVSRHILPEMTSNDWNILILHFLGVDHIGHAYGPFSEHLPLKLLEMDQIVKSVYEKMTNSSHSPALIVVCGDHGMTSSGSHGGMTPDELLTPLIFISTDSHQSSHHNKMVVDQVDFAPTLSAILGIPIPANSFGQIIPDVLKFVNFSEEEILYAAYLNFLQVSKVHESSFTSKVNNFESVKQTVENHYKWLKKNSTSKDFTYETILKSYETLISSMKSDLLGAYSGYNTFSMLLGLFVMWISFCYTSYVVLSLYYNITTSISYETALKISTISLTIIIASLYFDIHVTMVPISVFLLTSFIQLLLLVFKYPSDNVFSVADKMSLFLLAIHIISLFSSSYIEEEHQTWYYLTTSMAILMCLKRLHVFLKIYSINNRNVYNLRSFWNNCSTTVSVTFSLLVLHRIFRKWNQVGNKWQHLPDVSDWFSKRKNLSYLGVLVLLSQFILLVYFRRKLCKWSYILFSLGLLLTALQKLDMFFSFEVYTKTMLIPWAVYGCSFFLIIIPYLGSNLSGRDKLKKILSNFSAAWILLIENIGRVHNMPLIAVSIIQESILSRVLWRQNCSILFNVIFYFIMAMTSFFYYGNSNSISSIDVFTGYTGIQSYIPIVVGLLLVCNTYSTMVLWQILLFYRMVYFIDNFKNIQVIVKLIFLCLLNHRLFILSVYCIVVFLMQHHLFIYSVFLPKLFYEISHVILFSIINVYVNYLICRAE